MTSAVAPILPGESTGTKPYTVLYDGQCEVCQAGVSWLRFLDRQGLIRAIPITPEALTSADESLVLEDCLKQLHIVSDEGKIFVGWDAVTRLAKLFPPTRLLGWVGGASPFKYFGAWIYRWVAKNRYGLSKCRGGACTVSNPQVVRERAQLSAFWSCYLFGFITRLPLISWMMAIAIAQRIKAYVFTHNRHVELLDGKLHILFLNGILPDTVPILFGELFTAIVYRGAAIDPGSPKMRRSLDRHIRRVNPKISKVVATHAHEEHVGNLNWLARRAKTPIYTSELTARFLSPFKRLPWVRAFIIGQPPDLEPPFEILGNELDVDGVKLLVIPTPGHCDDHISLYDPETKLLLAGDAFMGSYFATPNPDVDSLRWLESLERLMRLDIEILVEGHGHIHTLRTDIPDIQGIVIREHPKRAIEEKIEFLKWLRTQIALGFEEKLPVRMIEASCFPWGRRSSWETCATDECIRMLSLGHFSRTELVRSFVRNNDGVLPDVYELQISDRKR